MVYREEGALADLARIVGDLGRDGGLMTPSVYDTAQVLRFAPPADPGPAVTWLLSLQAEDGGWGDIDVPLARHVPTLASILALASIARGARGGDLDGRTAILRGIEFLRRHVDDWRPPLPEDVPVGVELLFPKLLDDAAALGLDLPTEPYEAVFTLSNRRRRLLASTPAERLARTQAMHSWEAWGDEPEANLINAAGAIGDSPAATARFLARSADRPALQGASARARDYLQRASRATGVEAAGVVPTAWPIHRFEQAFGLYALTIAGLHEHPSLASAAARQLDDLGYALGPFGLAVSDSFIPDGDDTAAAIVALRIAGRPVDLAPLRRFEEDGHYCTWPHELQPSVSVNARAIHALSLFGEDTSGPRRFLLERQMTDGRFGRDKWNCSWVYTTAHGVMALAEGGDPAPREAAVTALLAGQRADGGFGAGQEPTDIETAWAILALRCGPPAVAAAVERARRFLAERLASRRSRSPRWWLAKETYGTPRVDRTVELCALLAPTPATFERA
ncbi:MAG: prenyltransferase/squalene oxidase repeat-containing protein [Polyangiaceae bacterium]